MAFDAKYQKYHGFSIDPVFQYWIEIVEIFSMLNTINIH